MSDGRTLGLLRRIADEKRAMLLPLSLALLLDVATYAFVVHPMEGRVATRAQRAVAAEDALRAAEQERAAVHAALTGKARANTDLATFYAEILPASLTDARRLTHLRLAQMAADAGLRYERAAAAAEPAERGASLERLRIKLVVSGPYADVRDFIHELETAPEFVVIDDVQLTAASDQQTGGLVLNMTLSTYFRTEAHGRR